MPASDRPRAVYTVPQAGTVVAALGVAFGSTLLEETGVVERVQPFAETIEFDDLDQEVRILPLPSPLTPELSSGAIAEMARLRAEGHLTALRGGRLTDLPRPLPAALRQHVCETCPYLVELLRRVETGLAGTHLFVRAVKLDDARASTTAPEADIQAENLHFDAELSSLTEYDEPVYQFYANAAVQPRQFRILPLPLPRLVECLIDAGRLDAEAASEWKVRRLFDTYLDWWHETKEKESPLQVLPVPSGWLAIFDGRSFAHDAGKADMEALAAGRFQPASEPDLVLALDTVRTDYHEGYYYPELPLLDDPGVS